jgi:ComF family protein
MGLWKNLLAGLRDIVFPPSCLACDGRVHEEGAIFCPLCSATIDEVPSAVELPEGWGLSCLISPLAYGGALSEALIRCKHGGLPGFAGPLALLAARRASFPEPDLVVPVPLHRRRLAKRGFNQSALMAGALSGMLGKPWSPAVLGRARNTPSQGGLSRAARMENVKGAFLVPPRKRGHVGNRRILLVDDVWTTGATCRACAHTLLRAGAAEVTAFTVCRVV